MPTDVPARRGPSEMVPPDSLFLGSTPLSAFGRVGKDEPTGSKKGGRPPADDAPAPPPRRTPPHRPCSDR